MYIDCYESAVDNERVTRWLADYNDNRWLWLHPNNLNPAIGKVVLKQSLFNDDNDVHVRIVKRSFFLSKEFRKLPLSLQRFYIEKVGLPKVVNHKYLWVWVDFKKKYNL